MDEQHGLLIVDEAMIQFESIVEYKLHDLWIIIFSVQSLKS